MTAPTPSGGAAAEWETRLRDWLHQVDTTSDRYSVGAVLSLASNDVRSLHAALLAAEKKAHDMWDEREGWKRTAADRGFALLAARRGEADAERYRALRAGIGVDLRVVRFGNPPDEDVTHIDGPTGIDAFADDLRAALAATPERDTEGRGKCPHLAVEFETVTPQLSTSAMALPTPPLRRSRCRDCGASLGARQEGM